MGGRRSHGCLPRLAWVLLLMFTVNVGNQSVYAHHSDDGIRVLNQPDDDGLPRLHCLGTKLVWTETGNRLRLSFTAMVDRKLHGTSAIHLQPMAIVGGDTLHYPELIYCRRIWHRFDIRHQELRERRDPRAIIVRQRRRPIKIDYGQSVHIRDQREGRLVIRQWLETCCDVIPLGDTTIDFDGATPQPAPAPTPAVVAIDTGLPAPVLKLNVPLFEANVAYFAPPREQVKEREEQVTIRITFAVDQSDIRPRFDRNAAELARIDSLLAPMQSHSTAYHIKAMSITGHTSPEGTYRHNQELSERRATSMSRYVKMHYPLLRDTRIDVEGEGEDWDGLLRLVEGSGMPYEDEVAHLIRTVDVFNGLESRLASLRGGMPYRYMLRQFFPLLRRMDMKLSYSVRAFSTAAETDAMFATRPQDLSHAEIYDVARRRNSDHLIAGSRAAYGAEFDMALHYYPHDTLARLNAASAALIRGDLLRARALLSPIVDDPRAANDIGVYYWLCGHIEQARSYFNRAKSTAPEAAAHNLRAINSK